jgi:hypothetical protein
MRIVSEWPGYIPEARPHNGGGPSAGDENDFADPAAERRVCYYCLSETCVPGFQILKNEISKSIGDIASSHQPAR